MPLPKCQHKGCREVATCYLPEKILYLCQQDSITQYPEDDSVPLVDDFVVEMNLKALEICRKEFIVSTQILNDGSIPPDEDALVRNVKEELKYILDELKKAQKTHKYYKFKALYHVIMEFKDALQQDPVYVECMVARAWHNSLAVIKGEALKSSELVEMELKHMYNVTFDKMSEKFKEFRQDIELRHSQEMF